DEDDGGAPGAAGRLVLGVVEPSCRKATPRTSVPDLRQGVQRLAARLGDVGGDLVEQARDGELGGVAGERPGEHVADEEVRLRGAAREERLDEVRGRAGAGGERGPEPGRGA